MPSTQASLATSGSKKSLIFSHGSLAQLGEHLPYKQRVIGSIPITSTKFFFRGPVVQSVRTLACHARGRRFESVLDRHLQFYKVKLPDVGNEVSRRVKAQSAGVAQLVEQLTCNQ